MKLPVEVLTQLKNRRTCRSCKKTNSYRVTQCRGCKKSSETFRPFRLQIRKS